MILVAIEGKDAVDIEMTITELLGRCRQRMRKCDCCLYS